MTEDLETKVYIRTPFGALSMDFITYGQLMSVPEHLQWGHLKKLINNGGIGKAKAVQWVWERKRNEM